MLYKELFKEAEEIIEKERKIYALEKLTTLMRHENQAMIWLKKVREDIVDLGTHEVGYPPRNWVPASKEGTEDSPGWYRWYPGILAQKPKP